MAPLLAVILGLGLAGQDPSSVCGRNPPSRASDAYWEYIPACGCSRLEPLSNASSDYDRYLKACAEFRERYPYTAPGRECAAPPPRASDSYWTFIDACGCGNLHAPSRASSDYDRFMKACSDFWQREEARRYNRARPGSAPSPRPSASALPSHSPSASPAP